MLRKGKKTKPEEEETKVGDEQVEDTEQESVCTNCSPEVSACSVCRKQDAELA